MRNVDNRLRKLEQTPTHADESAVVIGVGKSQQEIDEEVKRKRARLRPGVRIVIMDM